MMIGVHRSASSSELRAIGQYWLYSRTPSAWRELPTVATSFFDIEAHPSTGPTLENRRGPRTRWYGHDHRRHSPHRHGRGGAHRGSRRDTDEGSSTWRRRTWRSVHTCGVR